MPQVFTDQNMESALITLVIISSCVGVAIIFNRYFTTAHYQQVSKSHRVLQIIGNSIQKTILAIGLFIGLAVSIHFWDIPSSTAGHFRTLLFVCGVMIATYLLMLISANIAMALVRTSSSLPAATLVKNIINIVLVILGFILILHEFGVSITPLLTAVGVGGLAVALALQETLANLFAGIQVSMAGEINSGDYIRLDGGEEGSVLDMSWREMRLCRPDNNVISIPNNRFSKAIITNFNQSQGPSIVSIEMNIDYDSDLSHVEKVLLDVGQDIQQAFLPNALGKYPTVAFVAFDNLGIKVATSMAALTYKDTARLRHDFVKKIHQRFIQEKIKFAWALPIFASRPKS